MLSEGKALNEVPTRMKESASQEHEQANGPKFRGFQVEVDLKGNYKLQGSPGLSAFEMFGVLTIIMKKMEKELGVTS